MRYCVKPACNLRNTQITDFGLRVRRLYNAMLAPSLRMELTAACESQVAIMLASGEIVAVLID